MEEDNSKEQFKVPTNIKEDNHKDKLITSQMKDMSNMQNERKG